jgi:hypothetical protein
MRFWDDEIHKSFAGIGLGVVAAYLVAVGLAGAYRESEMFAVLALLLVPPAVLFSIYRGSEKRFVFCVSSLVLAGIFFDVAPAFGIPRSGLSLILMTIAAFVIPLAVDLVVVDMGRQIHVGPKLARMAQLAFVLAVLPLAGIKVFHAHQFIVADDAKLVAELAGHLWAEGDSLVVDPLDRKTADRALRRLAIRTKEKTYALSDADVESVRETRTVRRTTKAHGNEATQVTREQEDRLRLILKLQGTGIPDEVVLFSHRGPVDIAQTKVW